MDQERLNQLDSYIGIANNVGFKTLEVDVDLLNEAVTELKNKVPSTPTFWQGKAYCGKCDKRIPKKQVMKSHYCASCGWPIQWPSKKPDHGVGKDA